VLEGEYQNMNQKIQNEIIKDFRNGKYEILVSTSIGEEGLDIGEVDLIVCYDSGLSPIRITQRFGRTGRKRDGEVYLMLMNKEYKKYKKMEKKMDKLF
jgi:ERCC4-related helicase